MILCRESHPLNKHMWWLWLFMLIYLYALGAVLLIYPYLKPLASDTITHPEHATENVSASSLC